MTRFFGLFLTTLCGVVIVEYILAQPATQPLSFVVRVAPDLLPGATNGRLFVLLADATTREPRLLVGDVENRNLTILARDANAIQSGSSVELNGANTFTFPIASLQDLPPGTYVVQALFDYNPDLRLLNAPGNLISEPVSVVLGPRVRDRVFLTLKKKLAEETVPADTSNLKFIKLKSDLLSRFHGRPIYLRAGVILPPGFDRDGEKSYPLRVHIGGFGTRYTAIRQMMGEFSFFRKAWESPDSPRMILLHLDGAGPLGDPYQVNSANHGPYGDAMMTELIPHVEKKFRGMGKGTARVVDGHSTGGWVSLALQLFYPSSFQGAWSHAPDPVDFRAFELLNIYRDANAYTNAFGFDRPSCREINGDIRYTMRYEVRHERALGRGNNWTLSGRDWASWNATFGPRGKDGLPIPLWDGQTGAINKTVLEHWKKYDLRLHLERNWPRLASQLTGKMHIWVGDADDYFLNNAVHLLDAALKKKRPDPKSTITYGPRKGHGWRGLTDKQLMIEMGKAVDTALKAR